jgi:hypothetical protein
MSLIDQPASACIGIAHALQYSMRRSGRGTALRPRWLRIVEVVSVINDVIDSERTVARGGE